MWASKEFMKYMSGLEYLADFRFTENWEDFNDF